MDPFAGRLGKARSEQDMAPDGPDHVLKDDPNVLDSLTRSLDRLFANQRAKILVVDDSAVERRLMRAILRRFRFAVVEAESGEEALAQVAAHPDVRLVITDYSMPGMDGFELVSRLRRTHPRERLAIIGVSASGDSTLSVKFLRKGANDFLTKPFAQEEFYNRIAVNIETVEHFAEMRHQAERLALLNQQKNRFLGVAAHDLRNPLASIRGFSEIIESTGPLTPEQQEFVALIHRVSDEMLQLVNELLDVSAIESGRIDLNRHHGSFRKLIEERLRIHRVLAERKGIRIAVQLAEIDDCSFDANRISQVLDNLLSNAVKFSKPDTRVSVALCRVETQTGPVAEVSVADQGPGISEADQRRLFGEFQKLSARPTAGEGSTGLGLHIAKKIVEAHGGRIWMESAPLEGATFRFTLPIGARP